MLTSRIAIVAILVVQVSCAVFFVGEIVTSVFALDVAPLDWQLLEFIEIAASVGLLMGVGMGAMAWRSTYQRNQKVEGQLRAASGAFNEMLQERLTDWGLTPAERDVALFAIKGLSTQDIAALRNTSEGTVKAQTNAIYRKAGVSGRPQLLSLFIEELMGDTLVQTEGKA